MFITNKVLHCTVLVGLCIALKFFLAYSLTWRYAPSKTLTLTKKRGGPGRAGGASLRSFRCRTPLRHYALRLVQIGVRVPVLVTLCSEPERRCELRSVRCVIWFQKSLLKRWR